METRQDGEAKMRVRAGRTSHQAATAEMQQTIAKSFFRPAWQERSDVAVVGAKWYQGGAQRLDGVCANLRKVGTKEGTYYSIGLCVCSGLRLSPDALPQAECHQSPSILNTDLPSGSKDAPEGYEAKSSKSWATIMMIARLPT